MALIPQQNRASLGQILGRPGESIGRPQTCPSDSGIQLAEVFLSNRNPFRPIESIGRAHLDRTGIPVTENQKGPLFLSDRIPIARSSRSGEPVSVRSNLDAVFSFATRKLPFLGNCWGVLGNFLARYKSQKLGLLYERLYGVSQDF